MRLTVILALVALASAKKTFHGDQVLTVYPRNTEQVHFLQGLEKTPGLVDFWSPQYADEITTKSNVDIRIPKIQLEGLKHLLRSNELRFEVKISDLQATLDRNARENVAKPKALFGYDYDVYHEYDEVLSWAQDMASQYSIATYGVLGKSYENRDIPMLTITKNSNNPKVLVDCGIHAREWISPAFCQCFVRDLLEGTDSELTSYLDDLTFVILPLVNVDGYSYTWSNDRMWRKTRTNYQNRLCVGADPNRNFDALWSGPGSSNNPCGETYYGDSLESEPCVKALANYVRAHSSEIKAYVTFHSYGQMILYPYSYTYDVAANMDVLDLYAHQAGDAIRAVSGTNYRDIGQGATTIYLAAGGSDDFTYDQGVPLSYTIELPDNGRYGFDLPPSQINGVCAETKEAMKVMANAALSV